ncbi:hypothetical protein [Flavobacterium beibuense]|uniref:hypothetical protein n=1 Tax=Flavobacterium beibuense TaxID=657326 RepID=UPI003A8F8A02
MAKTEKTTSAAEAAAEVNTTETDLTAANKRVTALEKELKEKDQALIASKEQVGELNTKVDSLEADLTAEKTYGAALQNQLDASEEEITKLTEALEGYQAKEAEEQASRLLYKSEKGQTYEITVSEFRFRGDLYKSAEAIENHKEILEILIKNKSFILKAV